MARHFILSSLASPDRAWIILLVGIVLIYRELMAPGRILPGVVGAVAVSVALYSLWQHPWKGAASMMIACGLALLVVQGFRRLFWVPTIAAALLISVGAHRLTQPPISAAVSAGAIPLVAITGFLLHTAVAARRRKHAV